MDAPQAKPFTPGNYNINPGIEVDNKTDNQDNPTGGQVRLVIGPLNGARRHVLAITWQDGPRGKTAISDTEGGQTEVLAEPNGAFIEDVIYAALQRLEFFQASKYACEENAAAIGQLQNALTLLEQRRVDRAARGVEGQHQV